MERIQAVVIGAGVVGLAVARALTLQGREVLVLEAADAIGTGTSSRNSEVIHAGIYYPPGSLKARLCVQGKALMYAYCEERGIGHKRCGKLIVATSPSQIEQLALIRAKAAANGVNDLVQLSAAQARAMEPAVQCLAALHSPSTRIVDSHALMLSLQGDLENAGGMVAFNAPVARGECGSAGMVLHTADGTALLADVVINAAGLMAPAAARRMDGVDAESGLVHTATTTAANAHDITQAHALLHGQEEVVFADAGYRGAAKREEVQAQHPDVSWQIAMMPGQRKALDKSQPADVLKEKLEKLKASVRAKVEHPFRVIKCQFGHRKTRYRGLAKNTSQLLVLFALSNLWMVRKRLLQGLQA